MDEELKLKIQNAIVDMMKKVKFIEEKGKHRYETKEGIWLQGVSTVSSIIPKDWLAAWGAKEAVKFLGYSDYPNDTERAKEVLEIIRNLKPTDKSVPGLFIEFLKEAKGASGRKGKTALIDGKVGHQWLSQFLLAEIKQNK